ncbi:enoyl-CoA hydratase/isomerase family protein [Ruminococcus sp.]|uniref:enoyl-CoA hydratase/isomerase family protein n=1 Tax=Ruminococcus sp. TaxID=41978 RepID=UPI0025DC70E8|nr:enoyl-CoA hydratase/isomerase family protein [Ruminococcus sp.]
MNDTINITLTEENGVLSFVMDAPSNNIMSSAFLDKYEAVMEEVAERAADGGIKGMIIRGGGRHFSVGADVDALFERSQKESYTDEDGILPASHVKQKSRFTFLRSLPFPVVSVVTGFCIGSGSEIAVNSHYRVIEKNARIGQPESTFGILPALGGVARNIEICGTKNAYELVMSGELIPAEKAYAIGYADIFAEKKQGVPEALALIEYISANYDTFSPARFREYITAYKQSREANA